MSGDRLSDTFKKLASRPYAEDVDAQIELETTAPPQDQNDLAYISDSMKNLDEILRDIARDPPSPEQDMSFAKAITQQPELQYIANQTNGATHDQIMAVRKHIRAEFDLRIKDEPSRSTPAEQRAEFTEINASIGKLVGHDQTKDAELTIHELVTGGNESVMETNAADASPQAKKRAEKKKKEKENLDRLLNDYLQSLRDELDELYKQREQLEQERDEKLKEIEELKQEKAEIEQRLPEMQSVLDEFSETGELDRKKALELYERITGQKAPKDITDMELVDFLIISMAKDQDRLYEIVDSLDILSQSLLNILKAIEDNDKRTKEIEGIISDTKQELSHKTEAEIEEEIVERLDGYSNAEIEAVDEDIRGVLESHEAENSNKSIKDINEISSGFKLTLG